MLDMVRSRSINGGSKATSGSSASDDKAVLSLNEIVGIFSNRCVGDAAI